MNQPIIYAIVAMVCYGLSDFIYKQAATAGIRADHFLMAQGWFFCPLVILYALATHTLVIDLAALWGSLAGALIFIGFYYFIRSLAVGSAKWGLSSPPCSGFSFFMNMSQSAKSSAWLWP
jgi:hypothetical protein